MVASSALRGASAESLATLDEQLSAALGGADGTADAARVGDDLFGAAMLLQRESALRRTATDASLDVDARSGLVRQVLEGQLSATALDLVAKAATLRWTASRDMPDALEHLSVVATVRSAPDASDRLADELFAAAAIVREEPGLRDALADSARTAEDRTRLVDDVFGSQALEATTVLVKRAVTGTYRTVGVALDEYQKIAADVHAERVAVVTVAAPVGDDELDRLRRALTSQYGRDVHLNVQVDASVIGGMRVEIGDDVIDGTVSARLDEARRRLAG
ncbi:F0F1 ATP synthase subunit delta [uncultured Nocardioides sp.]|uniref:F0F1 ATP synthase subunit delta n=1 Tax=uncultured Nocardioides sp. TaxID=198441 RepID=UPI002608C0B5|nr:F0F1 ATP synthase subunit delta [uncultured Nocardioides sp.]